mmetsp:Transcript_30308/g.48637  ORF Transcript_30308/g.48637 Transcript_30308/m.48637 type:complete len:124 (+) Transcript_30308:686-1057(+)
MVLRKRLCLLLELHFKWKMPVVVWTYAWYEENNSLFLQQYLAILLLDTSLTNPSSKMIVSLTICTFKKHIIRYIHLPSQVDFTRELNLSKHSSSSILSKFNLRSFQMRFSDPLVELVGVTSVA